jgi:hypothetical protein
MSTCLAVPSKSKTFITLWPLVHLLYLRDLFSKINFVIHLTIPLTPPHTFYFKKLFVFQHWILSCFFHFNILVRLWSLVSTTCRDFKTLITPRKFTFALGPPVPLVLLHLSPFFCTTLRSFHRPQHFLRRYVRPPQGQIVSVLTQLRPPQ